MATSGKVNVKGYRELSRTFDKMGKELKTTLKDELAEVGEPVRQLAEQRALGEFRNVDEKWSAMRLGITSRVVWVGPKARRRGGSPRPKFGTLLMERAMIPALESRTPEVVAGLDRMLDRLADKEGF